MFRTVCSKIVNISEDGDFTGNVLVSEHLCSKKIVPCSLEFHVHHFAPIACSSLLWHWDNSDSNFKPSWTFMYLPPAKLLFKLKSPNSLSAFPHVRCCSPFAVLVTISWTCPKSLELEHSELRANTPDEASPALSREDITFLNLLTMFFLMQVRILFYLLVEQF